MSRVAQGLNFSLFRNNIVEISKAKEEKGEKSSVSNDIIKSIIERNGTSLDKDDLNAIASLIKNIKDVKGKIHSLHYTYRVCGAGCCQSALCSSYLEQAPALVAGDIDSFSISLISL